MINALGQRQCDHCGAVDATVHHCALCGDDICFRPRCVMAAAAKVKARGRDAVNNFIQGTK